MAQTVKALNYNRIYSPLLDSLQHGKQIRPPKFITVFLLHGRHFIIDKVICRRQAAAAKAGGQGDRYTIAVCGQERYLFFERSSNISGNTIGKWYVEVEVPVQ